ncbi:hypothetical protein Csa_011618 [Cucumis sativus]|uniref:Uncharacterized protein n=1 Tax=Cucumis sativus TaxID=3659 RepID=A0A0A0L4U2_CUCSA|nr:hypothetical protein Csa_011618 [Cucumis sativus]
MGQDIWVKIGYLESPHNEQTKISRHLPFYPQPCSSGSGSDQNLIDLPGLGKGEKGTNDLDLLSKILQIQNFRGH